MKNINIDYSLLSKQKETLLKLSNEAEQQSDFNKVEDLDGIIHLLDAIQDSHEEQKEESRVCSECVKKMNSGYVINDGDEYYCSDECLHKNITPERYKEMNEDDCAYWTEWEEEQPKAIKTSVNGKHTKGEWYHEFNGSYFDVKGRDKLSPNIAVFEIRRKDHPNIEDKNICEYEEAEANAKLIAAAPEMLEMLQKWSDYMDSDLSEGEQILLNQTINIINKATK